MDDQHKVPLYFAGLSMPHF